MWEHHSGEAFHLTIEGGLEDNLLPAELSFNVGNFQGVHAVTNMRHVSFKGDSLESSNLEIVDLSVDGSEVGTLGPVIGEERKNVTIYAKKLNFV